MTYSITDRLLAIPSLHFWWSVRIPWQKFQTHKIHKIHTPLQSGPGRALGLGLLEAFSEVPKCAKCRSNMVQHGPTTAYQQSIGAAHASLSLTCCLVWVDSWIIDDEMICLQKCFIDHATRCLDILDKTWSNKQLEARRVFKFHLAKAFYFDTSLLPAWGFPPWFRGSEGDLASTLKLSHWKHQETMPLQGLWWAWGFAPSQLLWGCMFWKRLKSAGLCELPLLLLTRDKRFTGKPPPPPYHGTTKHL